jgi:2-iminobutanoate/2-iminopropanoate deaminase
VFTSGILATDFDRGVPEVLRDRSTPPSLEDQGLLEAEYDLQQLGAILAAAGSGLELTVHVDHFGRSRSARGVFQDAYHERMCRPLPAWTLTTVRELAWAHCSNEVQIMAVTAESGIAVETAIPAESSMESADRGLSATVAGGLVFVACSLTEDEIDGSGDSAVRSSTRGDVLGTRIRHQLDDVASVLHAAGSSMDNVAKLRVATNSEPYASALARGWRQMFPGEGPASTIVPTPSSDDGRATLDIGVIAVRADANQPERMFLGDPMSTLGPPTAVRASGLLFLSGLVAADDAGLIESARVVANYTGIGERRQIDWILSTAEELLQAAGSSMDHVLRVENYLPDLRHLPVLIRAYDDWFGDQPPAITVVGIPRLHPPACSVMMDILAAG